MLRKNLIVSTIIRYRYTTYKWFILFASLENVKIKLTKAFILNVSSYYNGNTEVTEVGVFGVDFYSQKNQQNPRGKTKQRILLVGIPVPLSPTPFTTLSYFPTIFVFIVLWFYLSNCLPTCLSFFLSHVASALAGMPSSFRRSCVFRGETRWFVM